jgi:hypothetical protein
MANNLTINPLLLDTAHATNVVVQGDTFIYAIKQTGATGAGDVAELTVKSSGAVFWRSTTPIGGSQFDLIKQKTPGDLVLSTLTSGKVLVYFGPES